jgi:hypothetical protein
MLKSQVKSRNLPRNLEILKSCTLFWGVSDPSVFPVLTIEIYRLDTKPKLFYYGMMGTAIVQ